MRRVLRSRAGMVRRAVRQGIADVRHPPPQGPVAEGVLGHIDEVSHVDGSLRLRGWAHHPTCAVTEVGWSLPGHGYHVMPGAAASDDVAEVHGPAAAACRFDEVIAERDPRQAGQLRVFARLATGHVHEFADVVAARIAGDPYHLLQQRFFALLAERSSGHVAELGARARSGIVRRDRVPPGWTYLGVDIVDGPNVDVVADAHTLGQHLEPGSCDAVFSFSTFEHLAMPWRVALELNAVLAMDGLLLITSHQTYPLHDEPWDYWRFSSHAWPMLFNRGTGFEILGVAMGESASVVPHLVHPTVAHLDRSTAFLGSAVLARKVSGTRLSWDYAPGDDVETAYPG